MSLTRVLAVLLGGLLSMLAVVVLRAETTRIHYEITEIERRDDVCRQELRRERLALQRARNPTELLERVRRLRMMETPSEAPVPAGTKSKARRP